MAGIVFAKLSRPKRWTWHITQLNVTSWWWRSFIAKHCPLKVLFKGWDVLFCKTKVPTPDTLQMDHIFICMTLFFHWTEERPRSSSLKRQWCPVGTASFGSCSGRSFFNDQVDKRIDGLDFSSSICLLFLMLIMKYLGLETSVHPNCWRATSQASSLAMSLHRKARSSGERLNFQNHFHCGFS